MQNLLRRSHAAGNGGRGAPLVILDAGYSAAALRGCPVHPLIRLAADSVLYADPVTQWPRKKGRPGKHSMRLTCHNHPRLGQPPKGMSG